MASEQINRRKDTTMTSEKDEGSTDQVVGRERVPKMTSHFENLAEQAKGTSPTDQKSHHFVESEKEKDLKNAEDRKNPDQRSTVELEEEDKNRSEKEATLEEMGKLRAIAQQKSTEAIKAAEERYTKALQATKEKMSTVSEAKESCLQMVKEKSIETGKEAGDTVENVKDKAVAAGWTAAHYSTEKTVEGTAAVANAVKYVGSKAAELAAKPFVAAKDAAVSAGESAIEYTARKKDDAHRELEVKHQGTESTTTTTDQSKSDNNRNLMMEKEEERRGSSGGATVLGAIGETIVEIAQNTKDLVIGGQDQTVEQHKPHASSTDQS